MKHSPDFTTIAQGDREAFDLLVETYQQALVSFAYGILGDRDESLDTVQDVFVDIWLKRRKIEFGSSIGGMLYTTTRFYCYNRIRAARSFETHLAKVERGEESDPMDSMVEYEAARVLHEAIGSLPPRTAEVLKLTLKGLKQEEIGQHMGMAVTSVKTLKSAGIRKLKEIMKRMLLLFTL